MNKLLKLLLLFSLLTVIVGGTVMQTSFAQEYVRKWIENKSDGTLKIGRLEGVFPFHMHLDDVEYKTDTIEAHFDHVNLYLSPGSLIFGHLSLFRLQIESADIQTEGGASTSKWPHFKVPLYIHSMRIDSLNIDGVKGIAVSGMAELSEDFSIHLTLSYKDYLIRLGLEGDDVDKTIALTTQVKDPHLNMWVVGSYDWKEQTFEGETYGEAYSWRVKSALAFADSELKFTDAQVKNDDKEFEGSFLYNLSNHQFLVSDHRNFSGEGKLEWKEGEIALTDLHLHYMQNSAWGSLTYSTQSQSVAGELDVEFNDLSPYQIEGRGKGHLTLRDGQMTFALTGDEIRWKDLTFAKMTFTGEWKNEALTFQLMLDEFIVMDPAYEVFPTAFLKLDGEATHDHLWLRGEVAGLGSTPFTLLADIPIRFSPSPFDLEIEKQAPFSIRVKGRGSIDPILAFLENASLIAHGDVAIDLTLRGTWDNPQIIGDLVYDNGEIESLETGTLFRGIHMELEGEGNRLKIRSMVAHDAGRGDLSGTGWIEWNPEKHFPFQIVIETHRFTLLATDPLTANVNSALTISGNSQAISIQGHAEIAEAHLAIPNKMPTQLPTLDVIYVNTIPTPKPEIEEVKKVIPIDWDVQISASDNFVIEGRGLVSEWRGTLHISGPQQSPAYSGRLKLVQGRFKIVGRTFDLTEGQIQIEGLEPKDINVNLKGDLELATITASILVNGTLDDTHLSFLSTPPMSTNQILSWILFNQDVNELTPFQACRLANTLVSLSGKYAGPKVFDQIKEGLGIDVFDITNCDIDSADLTFQIGKYISQGTFVGVRKSISGDFDSVLIQARLYRNFYLEADYGGSLNGLTPNGGKMIFKWYKTY